MPRVTSQLTGSTRSSTLSNKKFITSLSTVTGSMTFITSSKNFLAYSSIKKPSADINSSCSKFSHSSSKTRLSTVTGSMTFITMTFITISKNFLAYSSIKKPSADINSKFSHSSKFPAYSSNKTQSSGFSSSNKKF